MRILISKDDPADSVYERETMLAREYQTDLYLRLINDSHAHRFLVQACASGKTMLGHLVINHELRVTSRHTHVIILAPTKAVRRGWDTSYLSDFARGIQMQDVLITIPPDLVREVDSNITRQVIAYLNTPSPGYAIVICAQAWVHITRFLERRGETLDSKGKMLLIDEVHHVPADGLGRAYRQWVAGGGSSSFGMTATHFRLDGRTVIPSDASTYFRSMYQQMRDGYAPRQLECSFEPGLLIGDLETDIQTAATSLFRSVIQDADSITGLLPKFVVRVPPQNSPSDEVDESLRRVTYCIVEAFKEQMKEWLQQYGHPSQRQHTILDVTDSQTRTENYLAVLDQERSALRWGQSHTLGIIGCQRTVEGIDWKWASNVYLFGVSRSMSLLLQFLGRGQRCKTVLEGYAEAFRDTTRFRAVIPVREDCRMNHAEAITKMALILGDISNGPILAETLHEPGSSTSGVLPRTRSNQNDDDDSEPSNSPEGGDDLGSIRGELEWRQLDAEARASILHLLFIALAEGPASVEETQRRLREEGLSEDSINWALGEAVLRNHPSYGRRWVSFIREYGATETVPKLVVDKALAALVNLCQHEQIRLEAVPQLVLAHREVSSWIPGQLQEYARRFRQFQTQVTQQQLWIWANTYREQTGSWPTGNTSGGPEEGESWTGLEHCIRVGARGLRKANSLTDYLARCQHDSPIEILETMWESYVGGLNIPGELIRLGYTTCLPLWPGYRMAKLIGLNRNVIETLGYDICSRIFETQRIEQLWNQGERRCFDAIRRELELRVREGQAEFSVHTLRQFVVAFLPSTSRAEATAAE